MRPTPVTRGPSKRDREFSVETMGELLRALRARAAEYPESPGLIASWPGVPADRMPAACAELQRQGHPVHEVAIVGVRNKVRRGWAFDHTNGHQTASSGPPALGAEELTVLVREVAEPKAVPLARAVLTQVAEREGVPETVRSALALAVTEACTNVVLHAYVDADAPGDLEVRARKDDSVLIVEVADDGRGLVPHIDRPGLGLRPAADRAGGGCPRAPHRPSTSGADRADAVQTDGEGPVRDATAEPPTDDAIRAVVARLARPHRSGGSVIERAAILAEGHNSTAILDWIIGHAGEPEIVVPPRRHEGSTARVSAAASPRHAGRRATCCRPARSARRCVMAHFKCLRCRSRVWRDRRPISPTTCVPGAGIR